LKFAGVAIFLALFVSSPAWAADAKEKEKKKGPTVPTIKTNQLAPLKLGAGEKPKASHAPFEDGDCSVCHKNKDKENPGALNAPVNEICLGCHEDFAKVMSRKSVHGAAKTSCVNCHNPHNSKLPKLLVEDTSTLCIGCHDSIKKFAANAKVKHDAVVQGKQCMNCHNPHGANVEHLLVSLPYDLCINCHNTDDVKDGNGKKLMNFKTWLANNSVKHGPVDSKDCSACHQPHGSENFRLLMSEYPAQFYSPYDAKLYALCFECHEDTILANPETTTLTQFRNGKQNLHYVHVHKDERGRTCRACHEVHAAKQPHIIRDAVPYGSKGWMLKVNYTPTPTGGSCAKTCHEERGYTNKVVSASVPAPAKKEEPKKEEAAAGNEK
jgi:predicted CXXCH cytochrome family protein